MLCFRKFLVAKILWIRGGGEYQDFPSKFFCLTVPKILVGDPFNFPQTRVTKNVKDKRGGDSRFSVEDILFHSAESFCKRPLEFFVIFGYRKMLWIKGEEYHDFSSKNLVSQCQKNSKGNISMLCFRKFLVAKILCIRGGGGISGFPFEIFLSHRAENFLSGTLLCFTKPPVSKTVRDKRGCDSRFSIENFFVSECRKNS